MPRRKRQSKARYEWTLDVHNAALDRGYWEDYWGGAKEGRAAWAVLRGEGHSNLGTRPGPWWAYEPDVPNELRAMAWVWERGPGNVDLQQRALRWLLEDGRAHLRPGEREAILEQLAREARRDPGEPVEPEDDEDDDEDAEPWRG